MDRIDKVIQQFVKRRVGGVIVFNRDGDMIYEDSRIILSDKEKTTFIRRRPSIDEESKSWEFTDIETDKYYRVETSSIKSGGEVYQCHLFTDVSDYASLFQDISNYSRQIADVSNFQSNIMAKLNQPFEHCLAELAAFCNSGKATLYVEEEDEIILRVYYRHRYTREWISRSEDTEEMLCARRFDMIDGAYCFMSDRLGGHRCALFLNRSRDFNEEYFRDISVYNVIRLYIENGLLREELVYNSEHDMLTGLYNKGKYLSLKENDFGHPDQIAIFNMDVNNHESDIDENKVIPRLGLILADGVYDKLWLDMSEVDREICHAISIGDSKGSNVSSIIEYSGISKSLVSNYKKRLVKKGIVEDVRGKFIFSLPGFARYVSEQYSF